MHLHGIIREEQVEVRRGNHEVTTVAVIGSNHLHKHFINVLVVATLSHSKVQLGNR